MLSDRVVVMSPRPGRITDVIDGRRRAAGRGRRGRGVDGCRLPDPTVRRHRRSRSTTVDDVRESDRVLRGRHRGPRGAAQGQRMTHRPSRPRRGPAPPPRRRPGLAAGGVRRRRAAAVGARRDRHRRPGVPAARAERDRRAGRRVVPDDPRDRRRRPAGTPWSGWSSASCSGSGSRCWRPGRGSSSELATPLVSAAAAVPIVALAPVFTTMFGSTTELPRRLVVAVVVVVPVFVSTARGLAQVTPGAPRPDDRARGDAGAALAVRPPARRACPTS